MLRQSDPVHMETTQHPFQDFLDILAHQRVLLATTPGVTLLNQIVDHETQYPASL